MTRVPESPYKGLAAFDDSELDALLFFGREPEIEAAVANVLASRLTVLYGPSGVGKSSLLRAGVARRLREQSGAPVVFHDAWAKDPAGGLISSVREECGQLGATAGLVDTVAAAAAQHGGELYLLLDQFEEYVLYHGADGPLSTALPELLRRPGLRVNVLIAIRDDALAELDEFNARIPELFANLLRLDRLDRADGRAAILGPLERYSELNGSTYTAEPALVDAVLDEASTATGVEAPYLQLVLERLWERERAEDSHTLRLETFRRIGGSRAVVHEHVQSALEQLAPAEQEAATRVVRQLVTPSGRKLSHEAGDLAEYAAVEPAQLRDLLEELGRRRIVRGVDGTPGAAARYEIFHDVLGPPLLSWQQEHQLRDERKRAARQRRRLQVIAGASLAGLVLVALLATFALIQRSHAQTQARRARGRTFAAQALADISTNPQRSVALALEAARLAPSAETAGVLRTSLGAMREERVFPLGGSIVAAKFSPDGGRLLVASSNGKLGIYHPGTGRFDRLARQPPLTTATWGLGGRVFVTGSAQGDVVVWGSPGNGFHTGSAITALDYKGRTLLAASGDDVRLENEQTGTVRRITFPGRVEAAVIHPSGKELAVAFEHGKNTQAELIDAQTGRVIRVLPEENIRSFAFSPNGKLLASGSYDLTARLWDAHTGTLLHVLPHVGYVLRENFSHDSSELVTSSSDGAAYVWDVASGQRRLLLVGATGAIVDAAISPDEDKIATGSTDQLARIYNEKNGALIAPLSGSDDTVTSVAFDPTGRTLVTGSKDGTARLWNAQALGTLTTLAQRPSPVRSFWLGDSPVMVAGRTARETTHDGHLLHEITMHAPIIATASQGNRFALLDQTGKVTTSWDGRLAVNPDFHITAVALTEDGALLTGQANGRVMQGGKVVATVDEPVLDIEASGGFFLVRTANEVRVYGDDGSLVSTIRTAADHATLSPGGLSVATAKGSVAQLWDATTGKLLHTLRGHHSGITDLAYSPNGSELATASFDHTGVVWNARTGELIHRLIGHFFAIYAVNWSEDGRWIVTASQFTAGLWNASTGQLMFYVGRTKAPLTSASFSRVGDWILTGSDDGTGRIYDCQVCEPLGQLEHLAALRLHRLAR
ncbi:MAG TPA: hypothetical protein VGH79_08585 [Gaiellaceae bacterium]|jgi:WD40 repeat protein